MSQVETRSTYVLVDGENVDDARHLDPLPAATARGAPPLGPSAAVRRGGVGPAVTRPVLPRGQQRRAADAVHPGPPGPRLPADPLSGGPHEKVVDLAIQKTLTELQRRAGDVLLVSHDGDFLPQLEALIDGRKLGVVAFEEFCNAGLLRLEERGVEFYDLEYDVKAFRTHLPRVRIIPIDEFDPADFL